MSDFADRVDRLEELVGDIERLDEPLRSRVLELLDGVDAVHRAALHALPRALGDEGLQRLREADPAIAWLLDAYGVGIDEEAAAEAALEAVRPYIHSHGGEVDVLAAHEGVVRVRLSGSCSGCTASAVTLRKGVQRALEERYPGFASLEVEEDEASETHPPPGPTLIQLEDRLG